MEELLKYIFLKTSFLPFGFFEVVSAYLELGVDE